MIGRSFKLWALPVLASFMMGGLVNGAQGQEGVSSDWPQIKAQTRWPFEKRKGQVKDTSVEAAVEALLANGEEVKAIELLESSIGSRTPKEFLGAITGDGVRSSDREDLFLARDAAYQYGLLWALTGRQQYREVSKAILLRFAEVMPHWPYGGKGGQTHDRNDKRHLGRWDARAIWGKWHPLDLAETLPLLKAYDLLRESLTPDERTKVEEGIFHQHKRAIDQFTGLSRLYHNLAGYHLIPLIHFGIVLQRPDYIHEVVRYWREMLQYSYSPDGFFRELSPDYHRQITRRIITHIPAILNGYSDPEGYVDPVDGIRYEKLDLATEDRHRIGIIERALDTLALPDGSYVALNDATPRMLRASDASLGDRPGLLGASGVAKLGSHGMAAYLEFGGIRGHDHDDALNLTWFAGGREVFSETGYRTIPGTNSTREWHTITASHHTIAVDETTQFSKRSPFQLPNSVGAVAVYPLKNQSGGEQAVAAQLPAAARYQNQGRLLVWHGSNPKVQAMEAEQERAYPGVTSLFRRTVVLLPTSDGEGILVDIFRVRGGTKHDSFLRGGYEVSKMEFNRPLKPAEGTLYSYIQIKESASVDNQWIARITYPDGFFTDSHLAGLWGGSAVKQEIAVGTAPHLLQKGETPIAVFRRESENGEPLESCYLFVHEAAAKEKRIQKVSAIPHGMDLIVSIERDGGRDLIFSGLSKESRFDFEGWQFTGSLAYARMEEEGISGHIFSGGPLQHESKVVADGKSVCDGRIIGTTRKEAGDEQYSILVAAEGALPAQPYRLAHIDFGDVIRFSIPVVAVSKEGMNELRVELAHSPGFTVSKEGAAMTQFPGWRISGEIKVSLE